MAERPYDYLSALGARVAITRNELALSQAKMAEALGISLRAYQSYELGKRSMPVEALYKLHKLYDVDLNWVLLGQEAARVEHDIARWDEFQHDLDRYLSEAGITLKSEKRIAICSRWYRSFLDGKEIEMDDVHTWIELLKD
jgi:transcriptional regulator with XRE-family HTH domain